jgi:hypothetical protein
MVSYLIYEEMMGVEFVALTPFKKIFKKRREIVILNFNLVFFKKIFKKAQNGRFGVFLIFFSKI